MNATRKKILGISGSTRINSTNEKILTFLGKSFSDRIDLSLYKGVDMLPHFNPDLDQSGKLPDIVKDLRELIDQVDGVVFCTPEYIFSLPGALKNLIEWTVSTTVFTDKPVAMIVASAAGEKAFESLKLILNTVQAKMSIESAMLIPGARGKVNKEGALEDFHTIENLKKLGESLLSNINSGNAAL